MLGSPSPLFFQSRVSGEPAHLKVTRAEGGSESCGLLLQCWDDRHAPSQDGTQPLRMAGTWPTNLSYILNPWQSSCLTQQVLFVEAIPQGFLSRQPHLSHPQAPEDWLPLHAHLPTASPELARVAGTGGPPCWRRCVVWGVFPHFLSVRTGGLPSSTHLVQVTAPPSHPALGGFRKCLWGQQWWPPSNPQCSFPCCFYKSFASFSTVLAGLIPNSHRGSLQSQVSPSTTWVLTETPVLRLGGKPSPTEHCCWLA